MIQVQSGPSFVSVDDRLSINVDERLIETREGTLLISVLNLLEKNLPQICYHESLGTIGTCDTCIVDVNGKLERACSTAVYSGMVVHTDAPGARSARLEAIHRILKNHELYCTLCDFNNGNCSVHDTARSAGIDNQKYPFTRKSYPIDDSNPFYRYDPDQCILCGRCVQACQNV